MIHWVIPHQHGDKQTIAASISSDFNSIHLYFPHFEHDASILSWFLRIGSRKITTISPSLGEDTEVSVRIELKPDGQLEEVYIILQFNALSDHLILYWFKSATWLGLLLLRALFGLKQYKSKPIVYRLNVNVMHGAHICLPKSHKLHYCVIVSSRLASWREWVCAPSKWNGKHVIPLRIGSVMRHRAHRLSLSALVLWFILFFPQTEKWRWLRFRPQKIE